MDVTNCSHSKTHFNYNQVRGITEIHLLVLE